MAETTPIEVSIVVPTYNQTELLKLLLASFDRMDVPMPLEVLVVDDCSPDDTGVVMRAWMEQPHAFETRYLRLEQNGGPGVARTRGAQEARGRIVAYTDSDCIVEKDWIGNLVRKLDPGKKIVGVGGRVLAVSEKSVWARHYMLHKILEPHVWLQYIITCNCCYLREPLLEVGGFPAGFRCAGGEDLAACVLLWRQGWRLERDDEAVVHHHFRHDLKNFCRTWYNYGYGSSYFMHRYLTREELLPHLGIQTGPNYWSGYAIIPTVTGVRSYIRDVKYVLSLTRAEGFGCLRTAEAIYTRAIARVCYLIGWNRGREAYHQTLPRNGSESAA